MGGNGFVFLVSFLDVGILAFPWNISELNLLLNSQLLVCIRCAALFENLPIIGSRWVRLSPRRPSWLIIIHI